jgi:hypothetical protein
MSGGYVTRSGSNLLFAPDVSNLVYVYEDSRWQAKVIPDAGITVACTGLSATTAYYLYVYDDNGTLTLDLSTTAPTTQNGIYVKTGAVDRLLIARCYTDSSGDVVTHNENAAKQLVCNIFNKRKICLYKNEDANSWTYSTPTWRPMNNNTADRIEFVAGGNEFVDARVKVSVTHGTAGSNPCSSGVGVDSTSVNSAQFCGRQCGVNMQSSNSIAEYVGKLSAGYHYLQALEYAASGGTTTWQGDAGVTYWKSGILGEVMA